MEENALVNTPRVTDNEPKDDYIVKSIGAFGPWQAKVCVIAAIVRSSGVWNMLSIVFLTPSTTFYCAKFANDSPLIVKNSTCYNSCIEYKYHEDYNNMFQKNIITEFNLICDNTWKASFVQTMLMFGFLLGSSLFGWISDRFGRRVGLLISTSMNGILMLIIPLSWNYWVFNTMRFFIGISTAGSMVISLVLIIEIVGPEHREAAGSLSVMPDGFTQALLSVFAYLAHDWRIYLYQYGGITVFIYIFIIFLPETPRWLMAKGNVDEAINVMTKAANRNKMNVTVSDIQYNILKAFDELMISEKNIRKFTYLDLFKTKVLAFRTIAIVLVWMIAALCYFGINQYITFISTNLYVSVILLGFIQIPTYPLAMILNKTFGRKVSLVASFSVISLSMTVLVFVPSGHIGCTIVGIIGLAASCITFGVLYVYASELFPTPLRNMAFGLASGGASIGAMIAPFIAVMSPYWIPSTTFAVLPLVACVFCILLPETKGQILLDIL